MKPHVCPKCNGERNLPGDEQGFPRPCPTCQGTGVVWEQAFTITINPQPAPEPGPSIPMYPVYPSWPCPSPYPMYRITGPCDPRWEHQTVTCGGGPLSGNTPTFVGEPG